jgi:ribonuclease E
MEEEALKERSSVVRALVPLNIASYLLNEKRGDVHQIEQRTRTHLVIVPNVNMETPQYEVQRIRDDQVAEEMVAPSYELTDAGAQPVEFDMPKDPAPVARQAAVQALAPRKPIPRPRPEMETAANEADAEPARAPHKARVEKTGLLRRLTATLFGPGPDAAAPVAPQALPAQSKPHQDTAAAPRPEDREPVDLRADRPRPDSSSGEAREGGRRRRRPPRGRGRDGQRDDQPSGERGDEAAADGSPQRSNGRRGESRKEESQRDDEGRRRRARSGSEGARGRADSAAGDTAGVKTAGPGPAESADTEGRPRRRRGGRGRSSEAGSGDVLPASEAEIIPLEDRRPSAEALAASKRMPTRDRSKLKDSQSAPPRPPRAAPQQQDSKGSAEPADTATAADTATPAEAAAPVHDAASVDGAAPVDDAASVDDAAALEQSSPAQERSPRMEQSARGERAPTQQRSRPSSARAREPAESTAPTVESAMTPTATDASMSEAVADAGSAQDETPTRSHDRPATVMERPDLAAGLEDTEAPSTDPQTVSLETSEKSSVQAQPEPARPASAAPQPSASEQEQVVPPAAAEPRQPTRPKRAYNDPREVRRRQREAELKAQGVLPRTGDSS